MSIQSEIERITNNVASAYEAAAKHNATIPEQQNSENLADTILSIPTLKIAERETATGENTVILSDVSSVPHKLNVRVSSEAEDFDPTTVTVTRYGKNIFNIDAAVDGSALVKDGDIYTLTRNSSDRFSNPVDVNIPANTQFFIHFETLNYTGTHSSKISLQFIHPDDTTAEYTAPSTIPFLLAKGINKIVLYAESANAVGTITQFRNFQIEIGDTATEYEPYTASVSSTAVSDGTAIGLSSTSPITTLLPNTSGVTLEADYYKETDKLIPAEEVAV